jgi:long-chain acyl-CoA synthetase
LTGAWTINVLLDAVAARGPRPALVTVQGDHAAPVSGAEVAERARRLAAGLIRAGVKPGDAVALLAPNGPDWVISRLAIGAAGGVAAAIDPLADAGEADLVIRDSGARLVLASAGHLPLLRDLPVFADCKVFAMGLGDDGAPDRIEDWRTLFAAPPTSLPELDGRATAMLVYTSGTTGRPKSFALTYANLAANVEAMCGLGVIGPDDRLLLPLPLHHVYPLVVGLLTPLAAGAVVVFPEAATGAQVVGALAVGQVTGIIGVPRLYESLLAGLKGRIRGRGRLPGVLFAAALSTSVWFRRRVGWRLGRALFAGLHRQLGPDLWLLVSAGAKLEAHVIWQLEGIGWRVLTGYGLAETASAFTGNIPGRQRIGSEGRPFGRGQVRIGAADARRVGEIEMRGPQVFAGYRNNPEANQAAFTADGWFRTGDQGYLDEDGFVYVTGRIKELIVLGGGKNLFPEALEAVYGASPHIREVAVLEHSGALVALVVPDLEAIRAEAASPNVEDVVRVDLAEAALRLPSHQRLTGFALTGEPLPRTRLGKYRRFELRALYEAARSGRGRRSAVLSEPDREVLATSPAREIWELLERRYPGKLTNLDASPQLDLGIDSLGWLAITMEMEARLGIQLEDTEVAAVASIRELIALAGRAPAGGAVGTSHPAGQPSPEDLQWLRPASGWLAVGRAILLAVNRLVMRTIFRLRVEGADNVPAHGPCVIAANHASDLDALAIAASLPAAQTHDIRWSGDRSRLFGGPLRRLFCRMLQVFPVDERAPAASLAMASTVLSRGGCLVWFPEGWRSPSGQLQRFLPGIGMVLANNPVPVVPTLIRGTFEAMPRSRSMPRPHPVQVVFATPREVEHLAARGEADSLHERIAEGLRREIAELAERTKSR